MVRGFTTKRLRPKNSLGDFLKKIRQQKKISLSEVESGTKVRAKYIEAIEKSNWSSLPQYVYTRGFVLAYAKFLNVDQDKALELYKKEAGIFLKEDTALSYNQKLKEKKVLITPKILAYSSLILFVLVLFGYMLSQILSFAGNPALEIVSPENNSIVEEESIDLAGITDADTKVLVNSENVPVSNDGKFQINIRLRRGLNVIKVEAINKIQKQTSSVYTVEYKPKTAQLPSNDYIK